MRVQNEVGTLDGIAKTIADKGISIVAISAWVEGDRAVIHLLTDDHQRALDVFKTGNYDAREADVPVTEAPHKPGMLRRLTEKLARGGIDIHHLYATATMAQQECLLVFMTANNDRAIV